MSDVFSFTEGTGKYRAEFTVVDTSNGLACVLTGCEAPHIGGSALASPRPSLSNHGRSADLWLLTIPGHKDMLLAGEIAKILSSQLNMVVCVSCGIHIDNASEDDIRIFRENSLKVTQVFISQYTRKGQE